MSSRRVLSRVAAGVLLANAVPHGVAGVQGRRFPTPFASPPGRGRSSPGLNVVWSGMNVVGGMVVLGRRTSGREWFAVGAGVAVMGVFLARFFADTPAPRN
jgi:hypothetical protein